MTAKEIADLAAWTANSIQDMLTRDGRKLDDAGADIIRECVQADLTNWERSGVTKLKPKAKFLSRCRSFARSFMSSPNTKLVSGRRKPKSSPPKCLPLKFRNWELGTRN